MMEQKSKFQDRAIAPMHTAEHILNQTMVRMFGCKRSDDAHIERKKSKINYLLESEPDKTMIQAIQDRVNQVIADDYPVWAEMVSADQLPANVSLDRLPETDLREVRLVYIGNYDVCACIGVHVGHTGELGFFRITSTSYTNGCFRIVFRLDLPECNPEA